MTGTSKKKMPLSEPTLEQKTNLFWRELRLDEWEKRMKKTNSFTQEMTMPLDFKLTKKHLETKGFDNPMIFKSKEQVNITVPSPDDFPLERIEEEIGSDFKIRCIDVGTQRELDQQWTLKEWTEYFKTPFDKRQRILNLISMEFTTTKLKKYICPPEIVNKIGWVENLWPTDSIKSSSNKTPLIQKKFPRVQLYCLMSSAESFTEFHIDFGGSSVWYHVFQGKKIFFVAPPTAENLAKFQHWQTQYRFDHSPFFGDIIGSKEFGYVQVEAGDTLMLPSGWIHAVYTPIDSIAFGGNFLSGFHIGNQLKCFTMEEDLNVEVRFRFPQFETILWFAALNYIREATITKTKWEKKDLPLLVTALEAWINKYMTKPNKKEEEEEQEEIDEAMLDLDAKAMVPSICKTAGYSTPEKVIAKLKEIVQKLEEESGKQLEEAQEDDVAEPPPSLPVQPVDIKEETVKDSKASDGGVGGSSSSDEEEEDNGPIRLGDVGEEEDDDSDSDANSYVSETEFMYPKLSHLPIDEMLNKRRLIKQKEMILRPEFKEQMLKNPLRPLLQPKAKIPKDKKKKKTKKQLPPESQVVEQDEEWIFDCICGIFLVKNYDDGTHMMACEKCDNWSHTACIQHAFDQTITPETAYTCFRCKNPGVEPVPIPPPPPPTIPTVFSPPPPVPESTNTVAGSGVAVESSKPTSPPPPPPLPVAAAATAEVLVEAPQDEDDTLTKTTRTCKRTVVPPAVVTTAATTTATSSSRSPKKSDDEWMVDCICGVKGKNFDDGTPMVECDSCKGWQHTDCVLAVGQEPPAVYLCPHCTAQAHGKRRAATTATFRNGNGMSPRAKSSNKRSRRSSKEKDTTLKENEGLPHPVSVAEPPASQAPAQQNGRKRGRKKTEAEPVKKKTKYKTRGGTEELPNKKSSPPPPPSSPPPPPPSPPPSAEVEGQEEKDVRPPLPPPRPRGRPPKNQPNAVVASSPSTSNSKKKRSSSVRERLEKKMKNKRR